MYNEDPNYDPRYDSGDGGTPPPTNWWEGPPPAGYSGPWPPPLPPGGEYGPNFGQVISPPGGSPGGPAPGPDPGWGNTPPPPPAPDPSPTPTPPPTSGGTPPPTTTAPPTGPRLDDPFPGVFHPPTPAPYPTLPTFTPPTYAQPPAFTFRDFKAPSVDDALNSPGYKFRVGQGNDQLQNWAAAKGTLNDSSTAKSLIDYGQNAGSQEYQNVWNRDFGEWGADLAKEQAAYTANYGSQYLDPYKFKYQGWQDSVLNPGIHNFDTQFQDVQHRNDNGYANAWNAFLQDWNVWKDQRDSTFDKRYKVANS